MSAPMTDSGIYAAMRVTLALVATLLGACQSSHLLPLATVPRVELERFMGDWYVIANIPTPIEKGAHNAVESYRLDADGSIDTTFAFRAGKFDGPVKQYHPRGFVQDKATNAIWGMRFFWPIKADYRIIYLAPDYGQTVIGRVKRDYVWIMARTPSIPDADYAQILERLATQGYAVTRVQRVPQHWEAAR
jgi:apolipoprotein D and lipocalin family protein